MNSLTPFPLERPRNPEANTVAEKRGRAVSLAVRGRARSARSYALPRKIRNGRFAVPTGKVKWFDKDKGFGFVTRDDGGDVFVPVGALPEGVDELKAGSRVEFGVAAGRRGEQALSLRVLEAPPSLVAANAAATAAVERKSPDELHAMIEDMVKVLESVQLELRRGRHPDRARARQVAKIVHAVASELEA
jgi:CspA family cold shock protein